MGSSDAIDFKKMNQTSVSILCKDPTNVTNLIETFEKKSFKVDVFTSMNNFFSHLDQATLGFIFVSRDFNSVMGKQLPGFLQRKFKVPVFTFSEIKEIGYATNEEENEEKSSITRKPKIDLAPEIVHLKSHLSEEEVVDKLKTFEKDFKKQHEINKKFREKLLNPVNEKSNTPEEKRQKTEHQVNEFLHEAIDEKVAEWTPETPLSVYALDVKGNDGDFLLVYATLESITDEQKTDFNDKIQKDLVKTLPDAKIQSLNLIGKISLKDYQSLIEKSENQIYGKFHGYETLVAMYFQELQKEIENINKTELTTVDGGFDVPMEDWFSQTPLGFNLFIMLEINKKKIHYVKTGRRMLDETYRRLTSKGVKVVYITSDELKKYEIIRSLMLAA